MSDGRLPLPIKQAIQHLRTGSNLQTVGLFRKVPSITTLEVCKEAYDSNLRVDLSQWPDSAILAGSIMKNYLRCLKYPIFPSALYDIIRKCPNDADKAVGYIQETLLPRLEEEHPDGACVVILLEAVMRLLRDVSSFQGMLTQGRLFRDEILTLVIEFYRAQSNGQPQSSGSISASSGSLSGHPARRIDVHDAT